MLIWDLLVNIVLFLLTFGILVFVHEFGHYLASRLTKTKVSEFAIGLGPKIFSFEKFGTNWVVRTIPFGGYCQIVGQEEEIKDPGSYSEKNFLQKGLILIGGVLLNFLLAVFIYYILVGGVTNFQAYFPKITDIDFAFGNQTVFNYTGSGFTDVIKDSPAEKVKIKPSGVVKKINDKEIRNTEELRKELEANKLKEVKIYISYDENSVKPELTEYLVVPDKDGKIGITLQLSDAYKVEYVGLERVFIGFVHSVNVMQFQLKALGGLFNESVQQGSISPIAKNVSGPVGIFVAVDIFTKAGGFLGILELIALLSLVLAFFNILPFPGLDGGHLLVVLLEKIIGRKIPLGIQNIIALGGFFILLILMVVVTIKDLYQFGILGWILNFFKQLLKIS